MVPSPCRTSPGTKYLSLKDRLQTRYSGIKRSSFGSNRKSSRSAICSASLPKAIKSMSQCYYFDDILFPNFHAWLSYIQKKAQSEGLSSEIIMTLVHIIESKEHESSEKLKIISCLIPQKTIPEDAFVRMTYLLSDFQFDSNIKVEILKWMITLFPFLESLNVFPYLYEGLLSLLRSEILRPYLCHLLYIMTDEKQVTLRRVHFLTELYEKFEPQPCIAFLLCIYYRTNNKIFNMNLKEDIQYEFEDLGIYPCLVQKVHSDYSPCTLKCHITPEDLSNFEILNDSSADVDSFEELHNIVENLKKCGNMKKIFNSPFRRLVLSSDASVCTRFLDYILTSLYINFDASYLSCLREIVAIGVTNPVISDFLVSYIENSNSFSNIYAILDIFSYHISNIEETKVKVEVIFEKLSSAPVLIKCYLLYCFSRMYQNWILVKNRSDSNDNLSTDTASCSTSESHCISADVYKLGSYLDFLCDKIVCDSNYQPCLLNQVLHHHERIFSAYEMCDATVIHLLSPSAFCATLFSFNSVILDNLCAVILRLKAQVCCMKFTNDPEADLAVKYLKPYIRDMHEVLWGERDLKHMEVTHMSFVFSKKLKQLFSNFKQHFVFHKHPAFLPQTISFLEQNKLGFASLSVKDTEILSKYLSYMSDENFKDFAKMMNFFLKYGQKVVKV